MLLVLQLQVDLYHLLGGIVSLGDILAICCKHIIVKANLLGVFALLRGNRLGISGIVDLSNVLLVDV